MFALRHVVKPPITGVMPRSVLNAVCFLMNISPTKRCIVNAPNAKKSRVFPIRNANIVVTGSTVRLVVIKFHRPACSPAHGVQPVCGNGYCHINIKAPTIRSGLYSSRSSFVSLVSSSFRTGSSQAPESQVSIPIFGRTQRFSMYHAAIIPAKSSNDFMLTPISVLRFQYIEILRSAQ